MQTAADRERLLAAYAADCPRPKSVLLRCFAGLVIVIAIVVGEQPESDRRLKVAMHEGVSVSVNSGSASASHRRAVFESRSATNSIRPAKPAQ